MIENNILAISNAMFRDKNWDKVKEEQKEQFFFIFNRYFSKKHLELAQSLNDKLTNKSVGLDLWAEYYKNKPYPNWFWSKPKESKEKQEFTKDDKKNLLKHLDVKMIELEFLINHHKDFVKEELEYLNKLNKSK